MSKRFILARTNAAPIAFDGEIIAETDKLDDHGSFARWHDLTLYKTNSGKYVTQILWRSNAMTTRDKPVEVDRDDVFVHKTPDEVIHFLTSDQEEDHGFDPLEFLNGFHLGVRDYDQKQRRLEESILEQFSRKVGELLARAALRDPGFVHEI